MTAVFSAQEVDFSELGHGFCVEQVDGAPETRADMCRALRADVISSSGRVLDAVEIQDEMNRRALAAFRDSILSEAGTRAEKLALIGLLRTETVFDGYFTEAELGPRTARRRPGRGSHHGGRSSGARHGQRQSSRS